MVLRAVADHAPLFRQRQTNGPADLRCVARPLQQHPASWAVSARANVQVLPAAAYRDGDSAGARLAVSGGGGRGGVGGYFHHPPTYCVFGGGGSGEGLPGRFTFTPPRGPTFAV